MKRICRRLQNTLAEHGPTALRDDEAARRHLEECDECFPMLEALTALDAGFEAMPRMDAPDELVESLLDELRDEGPTRPARRSWAEAALRGASELFGPGRPRLKAAVAFALLVAISPVFYLQLRSRKSEELVAASVAPAEAHVYQVQRRLAGAGEDLAGGRVESSDEPVADMVLDPEPQRLRALGYLADGPDQVAGVLDPSAIESTLEKTKREGTADGDAAAQGAKDDETIRRDRTGDVRDLLSRAEGSHMPIWVGTDANITFRGGSPRVESDASGPFDEDADARQRVRDRLRERLESLPRGLQDAPASAEGDASNQPVGEGQEAPDDSKGGKGAFFKSDEHIEEHLTVITEAPAVDPAREPARQSLSAGDQTPGGDSARELARRFLAERDAVTVASQPATGYWSNTYVPGDPVLRYLQARLAGGDRSVLVPTATGEAPPRLHDGAHRTTQPFDPPADAALAIQLQSDRSATLGETRILVQVGLAGTPRRGGRRPAMNVALVLDPRGDVPSETGPALVSLAGAFAEARDLGDRFRLFAAGRGGGELVTPESLRRGPAVVAVRNLLAGDPAGAPELGLVETVRLAIEAVASGDDPTAPLGSSAIVVATSRPLGADVETLAEIAHRSAVAGIPLSFVGIGDGVDLAELDALALAGQGSRRLLRDASQARGLVDRELAATGRAVARAVRLRINLAPGVRLVDVVGARRHGEAGAAQVRRAERALDQRLARNLGIDADRGDDEAGIQIVIPTFYAGDHHAILLDVVAPGPGPIADVTVRFKDLVQVENTVARARLELARGESGRGPLERNVLKNLLAYRLRDVLNSAGYEVAEGDRKAAARLLSEHRRLLAGLRREVAGGGDPDLDRDVAMLDEYVRVLGGEWLETPERRQYLVDSLCYAARLKLLPAPVPVGGAR